MTPPIVKSYIIAFEKYKWIGLASFALVVAGSTVVAIQPEPAPTYTASGSLTYSRPPVSFSTTGSEIQQQGQELDQQVLLSNQVIDGVSAKVGVPSRTIAANVAITPPKRNPRTGELESNLISLAYKDGDAKRAQEVLLELMQAMVKLSSDINTGRLKAIIGKINERIPQARAELQAAEKRLEQYDRRERPAILAAENGSLLGAVTNSQNQQRTIRQTITGIEAQILSLQDKLGLNVNQSYVASALSADPIIANLRSQIYQTESQIALLRKDLRPEHPNMVQLQRQKQAAEELLQQRAVEVIGGGGTAAPLAESVTGIRTQSSLDPARQQLANQMVALQTQKETLQQQLLQQIRDEQRLRQEYSQIPNKQLERSRLEQEVGLKKSVYDQMQVKLTDAQTAEAETVSSFSIAQAPVVGTDTKKPKSVPLTLAVGGFLGLIVGGGVIFLLGTLEGTLRTREAIKDSLKQREVAMLGEVPLLPVDDLPPEALPVILSSDSLYLEFYEKIRSNLRRISGRSLKVLLVTSTMSREGKTTTAYNLGVASARAGKRTLIIETDLRSPSRCSSLRIAPDEDGTLEPLRYYGNLSECIRLVPEVENLYIIPSPGPVRQSAAILESSEMRRLMEDVRERYDLVILDTPSLSVSNDPLLIQPYSDGIVLVSRVNYTQENMMAEAIDQLVEAELGLLGVIINGADITVSVPPSVEFVDSTPININDESEISVGVSSN